MKFGALDIESPDLLGAIVAHTLRLREGRGVIKKGRVLSRDDIERLRQSGYTRITVAQLQAGDIHEDAAAEALAASVARESVSLSKAVTGRCNLHARQLGLVELDAERIHAANQVAESITLATLPPHTLVRPGQMVATVKVIPFAVPESQLTAWTHIFEAGGPALGVTSLGSFQAGLVLTQLPGLSSQLLDRASRAQRARLQLLGSRVLREVRCEHDERAVARAIQTLHEEGCNPILLLGASAIVDRGDVIPEGLRIAGGEVLHFGMPVDPGNLLMLGRLAQSTVFGLPGCARSLNPSGFDQLLQRFVAGETIDSALIGTLGVGGLLKEVPNRPMPRILASPRTGKKRIAAVVLAAGQSRRMGDRNKLTLPVDGVPMVARVVDALQSCALERILVVTGHEPEQIRAALGARQVELVHNPSFQEGMGSSIRTGVAALGEELDGVLIALADMPWVSATVIDKIIEAFDPQSELSIYIPMYGRKRGNPVLWGAAHFAELQQLSGDVGGKSLFHQHSDAICYVDVDSAAVNVDVDTPEGLKQQPSD